VLYLIGEVPPDFRSLSDFVIFQNIYPPDPWQDSDLALPAAAFTEMDGTYINGEGRIQKIRKAVDPPGEALPDWEILCRIARKMEKSGFDFSGASEIHAEISGLVKGFGDFDNPERKAVPMTCEGELTISPTKTARTKKSDKNFPFLLTTSVIEHTYRGFPLSLWVEGAKKIFADGMVDLNPQDAQKAGISPGDEIVVASEHFEKIWPVRIKIDQPEGALHVTLHPGEAIRPNPHPVRIRKKDSGVQEVKGSCETLNK
jgi:predicted molibdopterin-dependent oxidoreductase YjgC